jgi:GNAT superfamily N-acetyltransferase
MRIELATIQDVLELQELQHKAFGPQCIELGWEDAPPMTESLEHAYEEFSQCTTLKVLDDEGRIIGSIRGNVTDGSLYMGRLMVLPEYRQQGIGKQLFREIQRLLPHNRAWLCTCKQVPAPYEFYLREGFRPYKDEIVGPGLTWVYMEKIIREHL